MKLMPRTVSGKSARDDLLHFVVELLRMVAAPPEFVQLTSVYEIVIDVVFAQFLPDMFTEIQSDHPAVFNVLEPFLVVAVIGSVEIEDVFADKYELVDSTADENIGYLTLQMHDVVMNGVVPFSNEFKDAKACFVIGEKCF